MLELPANFVDENFAIITVGRSQPCFHLADCKVYSGRAGQVAYWRVPTPQAAIDRFNRAGEKLYRGPLAIEPGQGICQIAAV